MGQQASRYWYRRSERDSGALDNNEGRRLGTQLPLAVLGILQLHLARLRNPVRERSTANVEVRSEDRRHLQEEIGVGGDMTGESTAVRENSVSTRTFAGLLDQSLVCEALGGPVKEIDES